MDIRIEHLIERVNLLQAVLLHGAEEDILSHLETVVEVHKLLVLGRVFAGLLGDGLEGTIEVVDGVAEILRELLDGELLGRLLVALGAVLKVAIVGDGAGELVLCILSALHPVVMYSARQIWWRRGWRWSLP